VADIESIAVSIDGEPAALIRKPQVSVSEKIPFRLFHMPCCKEMVCWIMPRYPTFCPRCGKHILLELKSGEYTRIIDDEAVLNRRGGALT
jgi:hypothetical protein